MMLPTCPALDKKTLSTKREVQTGYRIYMDPIILKNITAQSFNSLIPLESSASLVEGAGYSFYVQTSNSHDFYSRELF